jgi:nicotinate phosphoribosyltransferase
VRAQEILRYLRLENTIVKDVPRIILIDIFKDKAEESIRVACALGKDLLGVRLDTPSERGGVTPDLVKEVRARHNQAGFPMVKIFVSGGLTPEK